MKVGGKRGLLLVLALTAGWIAGRSARRISPLTTEGSAPAGALELRNDIQSGVSADESSTAMDRLHVAIGLQNRTERARSIEAIADGLDAAEIRHALDRLKTSRIPSRIQIMAQLLARWGELEPLAAIEFAKKLPRLSERPDAISAVVTGWMEHDPAGAEAYVRTLPAGTLRTSAWKAVIVAIAATDRDRAITIAELTLLPWQSWWDITQPIFGAWAVEDPKAAAARTNQLPEGMFRTEAQNTVARQWAETDPEAALAWALALPDQLFRGSDIPGSTGLTVVGADRTNAVARILETWVQRDGGAAIQWLSELPDDRWKRLMVGVTAAQVAESAADPRLAVSLAGMIPAGELRLEMLLRSSARIAQLNPKAGLEMISYESDTDSRRQIMSGIVRWLSGDDLIAALQQVPSSEAPAQTFPVWADPETAARWSAQQPNAEAYLSGSAGVWLAKDPDRAESFVRALPQPVRDTVYARAVGDPMYQGQHSANELVPKLERMAEWIPNIGDPTLREKTYRQHAERWLRTDAESARRWIDAVPISAEVRQLLLKPKS